MDAEEVDEDGEYDHGGVVVYCLGGDVELVFWFV